MGLVLAQAVVSEEVHPADDTSAMDGYALREFNLRNASKENPVRLRVVEDVRAGYPPESEVRDGQCCRISTGGLIPEGANAVEMREYVEVDGDQVVFTRPIAAKTNIRFAGEHLQIGEEVLPVGTVLGSSELGMAAYLGVHELLCHPRLAVAILATGSEFDRRARYPWARSGSRQQRRGFGRRGAAVGLHGGPSPTGGRRP